MDDLDLIRAARMKSTGPTDAATAAARAKLAVRMERPTRFSFRPRFSPLVISISTVAAVAVIATIAFTAFGMGVKGLHDPAIAPTPTATATPTGWTSPPQIAFDDDCGSMFSTTQVAGFFDAPAARLVDPSAWGARIYPNRAVIPHNGGLSCMWNDTTTDDATASGSAPWMMAVVLPAAALPSAVYGADCNVKHNLNSCDFTVPNNGYLLKVTMGRGDRTETEMTDVAFPALADAFRAAVATVGTAPFPYTQRDGDWSTTIPCAALFTKAKVWESLGKDSQPAAEATTDGWPTAVDDEMTIGHGPTTCVSGDYGNFVTATVFPGGSWLETDVASYPGMEQLTIDGADHAYRHFAEGDEGNSSTVWAFSGPNLLVVMANRDAEAAMPVAGLLRELDGTSAEPSGGALPQYTGTADCTNLLDDSTVSDLQESGRHDRGDEFTQKMTDATEQELHSFLMYGGIVCGWASDGPDDEQQAIFRYGPITPAQADAERAKFFTRGYVRTAYRGGETWSALDGNSYGTWVIGDGYWAVATESAVGNVIDEVISNAPEWKNLTSAKGAAATPASAPYLTSEGLGALRIGEPVPASNPYATWSDSCWSSDAGVTIRTGDGNSKTGDLDWILVSDDSIPTKSGIRVGDTIETLLATYSEFDEIRGFSDTTGYIIEGEAGTVVFEVTRVNEDTPDRPNGSIASIETYAKSYGLESVHGNGGHSGCLS